MNCAREVRHERDGDIMERWRHRVRTRRRRRPVAAADGGEGNSHTYNDS